MNGRAVLFTLANLNHAIENNVYLDQNASVGYLRRVSTENGSREEAYVLRGECPPPFQDAERTVPMFCIAQPHTHNANR